MLRIACREALQADNLHGQHDHDRNRADGAVAL